MTSVSSATIQLMKPLRSFQNRLFGDVSIVARSILFGCSFILLATFVGCGDSGTPASGDSNNSSDTSQTTESAGSTGSNDSVSVDKPNAGPEKTSPKDEPVKAAETVGNDKSKTETKTTDASETADSEIRILAWNIESNGANPDVIADQLKEMPEYDIYGFSEVRPSGFPAIGAALGEDKFYLWYSKSGYDDRLGYAIRKDRFDIIDRYEFEGYHGNVINPGNYRSPFVVELQDKKTGKSFLVVLNHLARGKAEVRQKQALAIRLWARDQGKPIIAVGDYNFDYVFATDKGNPAMDVFLEDGTFKWIRPVPMVDSNYYDEDQDGVDDFIDSLLDFVFAAGDAKNWKMDCEVVVRDGDFPDDEQTSDHRPVQLIIHP